MNVPLPPPPEGGRNSIRCETLTSTLLEPIPGAVWNGLPTYRAVKGASMTHQCPDAEGEHLEIPRQHLRNYQLTLRWTVYDADGNAISTRLLPAYYLWGGTPDPDPEPQPPVLQLLATIRRALWGV
jgi:hypothetical protein